MDIEPSMSQNQYWYTQIHCKPTQYEVQVGIFNNMPGGLALASNPLGLVPVATAQHQLAWPRIGVTTACLGELIIGILNHCCLGPTSVLLSLAWENWLFEYWTHHCLSPASVSSAPDWLGQPRIGVTTTCLGIGWLGPASALLPLVSENWLFEYWTHHCLGPALVELAHRCYCHLPWWINYWILCCLGPGLVGSAPENWLFEYWTHRCLGPASVCSALDWCYCRLPQWIDYWNIEPIVASAPHRCYWCLPRRIDYLNIEPIKCRLARHRLSWLGPTLVGSVLYRLGQPRIGGTNSCLGEFIIWILNPSWVKINIISQHNLKHRYEYLATCLGVWHRHLNRWA